MFAVFVKESDNPTLADFLPYALSWLVVVGALSVVVLFVCELFRLGTGRRSSLVRGLSGRLSAETEDQAWKLRAYRLFLALIPVTILLTWALFVWSNQPNLLDEVRAFRRGIAFLGVGAAALCAVVAVCWEFLLDLGTLSPRRIWAIARLSITEAIRRKMLWSFVIILAVFMFASWFIRTDNPEHQWRVYVQLVFLVMLLLLLITSSVMACFSLPNDIRQQTIHTVITKPVQRFELVLGRIVGFTLLMTVVLAVVSQLSLLYVFRGIDEKARETSMRARVPLFGRLRFEELDSQLKWNESQGIMVGREWGYRKYIRGGSSQEAVWRFEKLPANLDQPERMIPVEFTFDIFRTSKGGEDYKEGVSCQVAFVNPNKWHFGRYADYRKVLETKTELAEDPQLLGKEFGYYELKTPLNVVDYHSYTVWFPSSLLQELGNEPFEIRVACRSPSQYLGMAKADLYVLAQEGDFYTNYLKGTVGIWFIMVLVITLGVVFSTYLNALVSLLLTWFLLLCGIPTLRGFIKLVASAVDPENNPGGGPTKSFLQLVQNQNLTTPLEETRAVWVIERMDDVFRVFFTGLLAVLPDLGNYTRIDYIAEGFSIPGSELIMSFLILVGYLFPFLVAGYYLLNVREVAN